MKIIYLILSVLSCTLSPLPLLAMDAPGYQLPIADEVEHDDDETGVDQEPIEPPGGVGSSSQQDDETPLEQEPIEPPGDVGSRSQKKQQDDEAALEQEPAHAADEQEPSDAALGREPNEQPQKKGPSAKMDKPAPGVLDQATLLKYVNFKSLLGELAGILTADSYSTNEFFRLLNHISIEKLPKLFSLTESDTSRYFHRKKIKEFIKLIAQNEDLGKVPVEKKAEALKKCLRKRTWRQLFECENVELLLSCLIDLCYLAENTPKPRLEEYKQALVKSVAALKDSSTSPLIKYFNVAEIFAIIDDLLHDKPVQRQRIIKTIVCDASLKLADIKEDLDRFVLIDKLLTIVVAVLQAGNEPSGHAILSCIKWDNIVEVIPELFGYDEKAMAKIFDIEQLKRVIQKLQNKQPVTKTDLMEAISSDIFDYIFELFPYKRGVVMEIFTAFVDFDALASMLNSYFIENKKDRRKLAIFMDKLFSGIERHFGINVPNTVNQWIPEAMQSCALMTVAERIGDNRLQYSLPALSSYVPVILALQTLRAETFLSKFGYGLSTAATLCILYKFARWMYAKPLSKDGLLINSLLSALSSQGMRAFTRWRGTAPTSADIVKHASQMYEQHPYLPLFTGFVSRLTEDHLKCLPHPYVLCQLLEALPKPFSFIDQNGLFIESLCTVDSQNAEARIQFLVALLEQLVPANELLIRDIFKRFYDALTDKDKATLSTPSILMLALYRPAVLYSQHLFIESIAQRITDDDKPLLYILRTMTSLAKKDKKMLAP